VPKRKKDEEQAAAEQPAGEDAQSEQPAGEEGAAEQPAGEDAQSEQPAAEETAPEEPATEEPAAEETAPEEPAAEETAPEEPAAEEAAPEAPAAEEPTPSEPVAEESAPEEPAADEPVEEPAAQAPGAESDGQEPATAESVSDVEGAAPAEPEIEPKLLELAAEARYAATGKRKTSIARVVLRSGSGALQFNGRPLEDYFPRRTLQEVVRQPLRVSGYLDRLDVTAKVHGGGVSSQADAVRHGIAKALIEVDPQLRGELKRRQYLTRDPREKERRKAGLKKARKRPQFSKR